MFENNEKIKRKRWVYTRQVYEERYGSIGGKTHIWEIEKALKDEHYKPGENNRYTGACEDKPEEKKKTDGKYPPWVDVAIKEEEKIILETTHCQYIINTYHASTDNAHMKKCTGNGRTYDPEWCAAFVNYCLETSGYQSQQDPGARW